MIGYAYTSWYWDIPILSGSSLYHFPRLFATNSTCSIWLTMTMALWWTTICRYCVLASQKTLAFVDVFLIVDLLNPRQLHLVEHKLNFILVETKLLLPPWTCERMFVVSWQSGRRSWQPFASLSLREVAWVVLEALKTPGVWSIHGSNHYDGKIPWG